MLVLCNVGRTCAAWRRDHWNFDPVCIYGRHSGYSAYYTPIKFD